MPDLDTGLFKPGRDRRRVLGALCLAGGRIDDVREALVERLKAHREVGREAVQANSAGGANELAKAVRAERIEPRVVLGRRRTIERRNTAQRGGIELISEVEAECDALIG